MKVRLLKDKNYHPIKYKSGDIADIPDNIATRWIDKKIAEKFIEKSMSNSALKLHDRVSIVILVKDALKYFKMCLDSVIRYTSNYELLIVDNGSKTDSKKYLQEQQAKLGFTLITNKENKGFSYGNNQAIKVSTCDYICFLNSDCVVTRGWLSRLMQGFEYPDAGIIGPSTSWAGSAQMIQGLVARHDTMTLDEINAVKLESGIIECELMGFCYLVSKKVIDKIGVFDWKRYGLGLSEEKDFNWRAVQAGFKLYWVKDVYVHHWGNKTFNAIGIDPYKFLTKNRSILTDRIKNDTNIFIKNDTEIINIKGNNINTDVIITTLDRQEETCKTLDSLFKNNTDINVIIIDNGSDNLEYLSKYNVKVIKNEKNLGVPEAFNLGLRIAKSEYVVVMHNDVIVNTRDWIKKAISYMKRNDDAGMVGIAGWIELNAHGNYETKNLITAIEKYNQKPHGDFAEISVLDGCCNVIRNIGLKFDNIYGYMHFYDLDMSMQYRQEGYRLYVINGSAIHLAEDRKTSSIENEKYKSLTGKKDVNYYLERNEIFISKWNTKFPVKREPIPIKLITWNRLEYTKKTINSILENTDYPFTLWIWDNASTDGTIDYLKNLRDPRIQITYSDINTGLVPPFNIFLEQYKTNKYIAQLDNDIIVPPGWLSKFKAVMDNLPIFSISADHYLGIPYRIKTNKEFYDHLETIEFEGDKIYLFPHAGMGNMVRRKWLDIPVQVVDGNLGGWVRYQCDKWKDENRICAFHGGVWIDLQDMEATNTPRYDYPDYREKTNLMRSGDKNSSGFGTKDLDIPELEGIRKQVKMKWEASLEN